jgi:pyruvate dehydrogenase E2 component (dihydrolipoamide acetyltransferase)
MKKYKMKINGENYEARIVAFDAETAVVEVNGNTFEVEFDDNEVVGIPKISRATREVPGVPQLSVDYADGSVKAPIPGVIVSIKFKVGDRVEKGTPIVILEAMKMESEIEAPASGVIEEILVKEKAAVHEGDALVKIKFDAPVEAPKPKKASRPATAPAAVPQAKPASSGANAIVAPIPGTIIDVLVNEGDTLSSDQAVIILEAMKMESEVTTDYAGKVKKVLVSKGQAVQEGEQLILLGD